jgi:anti-sigma factor RsiW
VTEHKQANMNEQDELVNALIDGELSEQDRALLAQRLAGDSRLQQMIADSLDLQQALCAIPMERAPASLRRKLRRIPRQQKALSRSGWLQPGWSWAVAAVPLLVLAIYLPVQHIAEQERQLAQARDELALALVYLHRANQRAGVEVQAALQAGLTRPVTEQTVYVIQQPLATTSEYQL